jgi:hypothetical protein
MSRTGPSPGMFNETSPVWRDLIDAVFQLQIAEPRQGNLCRPAFVQLRFSSGALPVTSQNEKLIGRQAGAHRWLQVRQNRIRSAARTLLQKCTRQRTDRAAEQFEFHLQAATPTAGFGLHRDVRRLKPELQRCGGLLTLTCIFHKVS